MAEEQAFDCNDFSQNFFVFDVNQLKNSESNNFTLIMDDDIEFTREHFFKPIKFGVVPLDD